jgi:hypothetical protein
MPKLHKIASRMRKDIENLGDEFLVELKKMDKLIRRSLEKSGESEHLKASLKSIEQAASQLGATAGQYLHRLSDRATSRGVQLGSLTSLFHAGVKQGSDQAKAKLDEKKQNKNAVAIKKAAKKAKISVKKQRPSRAPAKPK